ncbi:unnamed protein product [Pleuronectes platessa]|uniref:Uncharacterized protein n=1 Tax=Pleuronectes platessa TaxID=8262 RepID=A0A9N7TLG0_PLEPL|nr:unnamed protein product [Pleuronectes platessa]
MSGNKPQGSVARHRASLSVCVNSSGCRKRWIRTVAVSKEAVIAMEPNLPETPDLNPITAAVCVCSLRTPAAQETGCHGSLCRHESNADPSRPPAASLLSQPNDTVGQWFPE